MSSLLEPELLSKSIQDSTFSQISLREGINVFDNTFLFAFFADCVFNANCSPAFKRWLCKCFRRFVSNCLCVQLESPAFIFSRSFLSHMSLYWKRRSLHDLRKFLVLGVRPLLVPFTSNSSSWVWARKTFSFVHVVPEESKVALPLVLWQQGDGPHLVQASHNYQQQLPRYVLFAQIEWNEVLQQRYPIFYMTWLRKLSRVYIIYIFLKGFMDAKKILQLIYVLNILCW